MQVLGRTQSPGGVRLRVLVGLLTQAVLAGITYGASAQSTDFGGSCTWYGHVPVIVGIEKGFFASAGLNVKFVTVVASSDRMLALTSGDVGWVNTGQLSVVSEMARRNRSFYWIGMMDEVTGQEGLGVRPSINSVGDLRGKRVAVPRNSSAEVTLWNLLKDHGLRMEDVEIVPLQPTEIATAFARGLVDAFAIWEPVLSRAVSQVPQAKILATNADTTAYRQFGTPPAGDILAVRRDVIDNPEKGPALLKALHQAIVFVQSNPEEAAAIVAPCYQTDAQTALRNIRAFRYYNGLEQRKMARSVMGVLKLLVDWAHETGRISERPDPSQWMNVSAWPSQ